LNISPEKPVHEHSIAKEEEDGSDQEQEQAGDEFIAE